MKHLFSIFAFTFCTIIASAQHWSVSPYDYRYDMTLYAVVEGFDADDYANYEIAAFVGDECRGTLQYLADGYGYMRIYSNKVSGEQVTFRLYNRLTAKTTVCTNVLRFYRERQEAKPSVPLVLVPKLILPGDTNNDGVVSLLDVSTLISILNGSLPSNSNADVNSDGQVNMDDLQELVDMIV